MSLRLRMLAALGVLVLLAFAASLAWFLYETGWVGVSAIAAGIFGTLLIFGASR